MSSTTGTCQICGGGGVVPPSLVEITCISNNTEPQGSQVLVSLLEMDGEWEGVLPNASVSSGLFWPFGGVRVWPSIWILTPDF